jgi:membrane-associated phospholipid phosphatase
MNFRGLPAATGRRAALVTLLFALSACAAQPSGAGWGEGADFTPGWQRLGQAALTAATDPFTWAPAVGAAALQIGGADRDIADWANDHTPVFGSRNAASDASDWLRLASLGLYVGTGLAAPTGASGDPVFDKAKGFAVGVAALAATAASTEALKRVVARERPQGSGDDSFPSGHMALTATAARLTHQTLGYYGLTPGERIATDTGLAGLALMTGWARVESGEHHPADVLAGAALGNFFAVFATEAFLRPAGVRGVALGVSPSADGMMLQASFAL